jgi:TolB-like protein
MFTDMVGYTALAQRNESLSLALVEEQRKLIRPILARHNGREIKTIGDAFLVEFPNALDAVRCAYDIQRATREFNFSLPAEKRIHLRVGLHLGDVVEEKGDISGDAVNVASRIEPLAEDGGVCLSRQVYESIHNKFEVPLQSMGAMPLKNVLEPVEVYRMEMPWASEEVSHTPQLETTRVAVLPFVSLSPDPNDEYFADGLTEELIDRLCQIAELKVIARTSVMTYKRKEKNAAQIGRELRAGALVEGSVRKADSRIRVTAQLINANTEEHLWSSRYDRNLEDIFEVQGDVARQVAEALRVRILSPEAERIERKPTRSTMAYELYLKGRSHWNRRGIDETKKAMEYFGLAVHEDSQFALGYVGQADCHLILENWGVDMAANQEQAKEVVAKALALDPELAEAHATRALALMNDHNLQLAEAEFKRAIGLKPSYATAHQWYYLLLLSQLRWDEALAQVLEAVELDPLSPVINYNHAVYYFARRDFRRALELNKHVVELDPKYAPVYVDMINAYGRLKMWDEMRRAAAAAVDVWSPIYDLAPLFGKGMIAMLEEDKETIRSLIPELEARIDEPGNSGYFIATCYFHLGENDRGFEWLERGFSKKEDFSNMKWDPDLDGIRTDPRYLDLLKRLGLG